MGDLFIKDYVKAFSSGNYAEVCLYNEDKKVYGIGEKMNEINEYAYMNGYNWEAFLNCYLAKKEPALLEGLKTDPEAGMYTAYYGLTPENEQKAKKFAEIISSLIENEEELFQFLRDNGDEIEWD
ncbi:MAG: Imm51 family immunity protein [Lachnospiraceae bacterium]|nr:Imm51 family immunity protein [Lachnospiraceae bacterium]